MMKRFFGIGLVVVVVATLMASVASAQRSALAKANGQYGAGFWHSTSRQVATCPQRNVVMREAQPAVASNQAQKENPNEENQAKVATQPTQDNSYQRYSYEPSAGAEQRPAQTYQRRSVQSRSSAQQPSAPEVRLHPGTRKW
jgi:hypothetical protein